MTGFPGDEGQFTALQQNMTCYGEWLTPFSRAAAWGSTNTAVATVSTSGMGTALSPGSTQIEARWTSFLWDLMPSGTCSKTIYNVLAGAACDVLAPKVIFKDVTWSSKRAVFSLPFNDATLDLSGDRLTTEACGGQQFAINVTFYQPEHSAGCCRNPISNFASAFGSSQYRVIASDFYENGTTTGEASVTLKRTGEGTKNIIKINVSGTFQSGDTWSGVGTVYLQCP